MKISIIGSGYVGLVTGACLAEVGNQVVCLDIDSKKIEMLNNGIIPIHEPGLEEMIKRNQEAKRISFTTDPEFCTNHGKIQFIAVGTPPDEDGSADLKYVLAAAENIGRYMKERKIIVNKSTVPVGTAKKVEATIAQTLKRRQVDIQFSVASNPEFLKEGAAIDDFMSPDRVVIGTNDPYTIEKMRELYAPFQRNHERIIFMDTSSSELTKYAANAMLATRISFMNELANLAEKLGANIENVRLGIGSDPRIGYHFLYSGCGYGGSCFPKDVQALQKTALASGLPLRILKSVEEVNENQKHVLVHKAQKHFDNNLKGRRFALWGLAFKPNTDDMREAPSRTIINDLIKAGATVSAYDPIATSEAKRIFAGTNGIQFFSSMLETLDGADALFIATEWKEFRSPNFDEIKSRMKAPIIFDGRNLYSPETMKEYGIAYHSIGRG